MYLISLAIFGIILGTIGLIAAGIERRQRDRRRLFRAIRSRTHRRAFFGTDPTIVEMRVVSPPDSSVVEKEVILSKDAAKRLEIHGEVPKASRIDKLEAMTSQAGWDGPRSQVVSVETWRSAREIIASVRAEVPQSGEPFLSPGTDGSIGLHWCVPGRAFSMEIASDGVFFCLTTRSDVVSEGPIETRDIIDMVRKLYPGAKNVD